MKYRWDKKYLYWGITAFAVIACCIVFYWCLSNWAGVKSFFGLLIRALSPIIYGLVIAYLLDKVLMFFEKTFFVRLGKRMFRKKPGKAKKSARVMSILLTMILMLLFFGGLLALVLPQIYNSIEKLVVQMPHYVNVALDWAQKFLNDNPDLEATVTNLVGNVSEYLKNWLQTSVLPRTQEFVTNITGGVISAAREILNIIIGIIISVYVMYHKETFGAQSKKLLYSVFKAKPANWILEKTRFLDKTFGGFISGKLIDSLIVGLLCYVVLAILQMPYAALVSVIIGVTNIIPFFGPLIGAVPCALLILLEDPVKCLIFVIFIVILQQFDGNVLGPKILGNTTGLSGFWIMFAILLFGSLFGFWGFILGVPLLAVIYTGIRNFSSKKLQDKNLPAGTSEFVNLAYIDAETNAPVYRAPSDNAAKKNKTESSEAKQDEEKNS